MPLDEILPCGVFPRELIPNLPFTYCESTRILGAAVDNQLNFGEQVAEVIARSRARHGVLAGLAGGI